MHLLLTQLVTAVINRLLTGPKIEVNFDSTKFGWLGSVTNDTSACVTWHTSAVKTWNDFLEKPALAKCPNCHEMKQPHHVCPHCGYYKGRAVQEKSA